MCKDIMAFINVAHNASGAIALKSVVKQHINSESVKKFLKYTFDTITYKYNFKVNKKDFDALRVNINNDCTLLFHTLQNLRSKTRSDAHRETCEYLLKEYGIIAYSIFNRRIPGVALGAKTINAALGEPFITEFLVQKAKDLDYSKLPSEFYMERKYDGNNVYIIGDRFFTRNGEELHLPEYSQDIRDVNFGGVLVTEAIVKCGKLGERTITQGICTKCRVGTATASERQELKFKVFDYLTKEEWETKKCNTPYYKRSLRSIAAAMNFDWMSPIHMEEGSTKEDVQEFLTKELAAGFEGIVVKPKNHKFSFKRSWDWMRFKEAKTLDAKIVDIVEGEGKHAGRLGAFICVATYNDKQLEFRVGTGFTDFQREQYWREPVIGKVIELTYNEITDDGSVTIPVFKCIREDKQEFDNG